ncbi:MAG: ATP-dependent zinc metalloprotease FtsH, partial [Actinomycetota bacterium]
MNAIYNYATKSEITSARLLDEDAVVVGLRCPTKPGAPAPVPIVNPSDPNAPPELPKCPDKQTKFHAAYPRSDVATGQLIDRIAASSPLVVDKQTNKAIAKLVVGFVFPLLMLANLFGIIFLSKSAASSIGDIVGFGKIGKKQAKKRHPGTGVTFANVAGAQEAMAELKEVTDYLTNPAQFEEYGASPPKGVLLFGPPGCGKTLLARAVAGESGVPFFAISGAEFVESLVGIGAARVRDLFAQVKQAAPAIVFIDEIDAVGRKREGEGATGGEREQTVNQLLVEMDGFETSAGIVVVGATNRPDILDPALLRPGRFDRHVTLEAPDPHGRAAILKLHAKGKPMADDVDFEALARKTPGFTGADLANVINEAALLALRGKEGGAKKGGQINSTHVNEAILRVLHGPQRRGRLMSQEERHRLAFHETGHTLVAACLGQNIEDGRVSILPRGRGLGQSILSDESERVLLTVSQMQTQLTVAMAGIAAEVLWFGESSTTSEQDIDKATETARQMVGRYGMSAELGPVRLLSKFEGYLGAEAAALEMSSGETLQQFDREVRSLIVSAQEKASAALDRFRKQAEALSATLEKEETLEGPALERLLAEVRSEANSLVAPSALRTG